MGIYRKDFRLMPIFIVIFSAWYLYHSSLAMGSTLLDWLSNPLRQLFQAANLEQYQGVESTARAVTRYSQLTYLALYVVLVGASVGIIFLKKGVSERKKQILALLCWAIGSGLIIFSGYGQALYRVYVFCLPPAVCIIVLSLADRKIMKPVIIALMCALPLVSLLATYGGEAAFSQVRTTELKGAEFFADKVNPRTVYFYQFNTFLIDYYNPALITVPAENSALSKGEVNFSVMSGLKYVILSKQGSDSLVYAWSEDPYACWVDTEAGKAASLLYTNGYFQVYENNLNK